MSVSDPLKPSVAAAAAADSAFAGAKDTAAVGVMTEDPTCTAWTEIDAGLKAAEQLSWSGRDPSIPASGWTQSRRDSYDSVAAAMRTSIGDGTAAARGLAGGGEAPHCLPGVRRVTRCRSCRRPPIRSVPDGIRWSPSTRPRSPPGGHRRQCARHSVGTGAAALSS